MATTHYIWDELSDNVLMETDEAGAVTAEYTNEPDEFGKLISQRRDGVTSYYHFDGQGSARQLTDANETVTDEATYSAFGEEVASSGSTVNPWGYKGALGYYANPKTNDLYVRRHWLSPIEGRWLSPNHLGLQFINQYAYQSIVPMLGTGAFGLQPVAITIRRGFKIPFFSKFVACVACGAAFGTYGTVCVSVCVGSGFWDVPGERFSSCFGKCLEQTWRGEKAEKFLILSTGVCAACLGRAMIDKMNR